MILSILIATVEERAEQFKELRNFFLKFEGIDVVSLCDNKEMSIGKKRQQLLEMSGGEYIVFFDDDDWPNPSYVHDILTALEEKPDCVGFKIQMTTNGTKHETCIHSLSNKVWDKVDGVYLRNVTHFNPVKRSIALNVGFPDLRYAEDRSYSDGVSALCKTEVFIDKYLFNYRYSNKTEHSIKYGIKDNS